VSVHQQARDYGWQQESFHRTFITIHDQYSWLCVISYFGPPLCCNPEHNVNPMLAATLEAMRAAAKDPDEMIASWGAGEEELMEEYKEIRRAAREKKRNGK